MCTGQACKSFKERKKPLEVVAERFSCSLCSSSPAQQEAQRAQFLVEKAKQEQRQKIVQAEGEATAAQMISLLCCGETATTQFSKGVGSGLLQNPQTPDFWAWTDIRGITLHEWRASVFGYLELLVGELGVLLGRFLGAEILRSYPATRSSAATRGHSLLRTLLPCPPLSYQTAFKWMGCSVLLHHTKRVSLNVQSHCLQKDVGTILCQLVLC